MSEVSDVEKFTTQEDFRKLLDGNLEPAEIASNPTLASLAERIYGVTYQEITPSKSEIVDAKSNDSSSNAGELMIEIVGGTNVNTPFDIPPAPAYTKQIPKSAGKLSIYSSVLGLIMVSLNMIGIFGKIPLIASICEGSGCPADGNEKLNWASIGNIGNGFGWSESALEGSIGIPDIGLGLILLFILFVSLRRRS